MGMLNGAGWCLFLALSICISLSLSLVQAGAYSFHYVVIDTPTTSGSKICFLTLVCAAQTARD